MDNGKVASECYKKDGNWGLLFRWGLNAPDSEAAVFHVAPPTGS